MRILIAGLAKTGTTGLLFLIVNSFKEKPRIIFEPKERPADIGEYAGHTVAKMLIGPGIDACALADFEKKITIVRDPRDRFISNLLYSQFHANYLADDDRVQMVRGSLERKEASPASMSMQELLEIVEKATGVSVGLTGHLHTLRRYLEMFDDYVERFPASLIYRYEDFVSGNYAALEEYLGLDIVGKAQVPDVFARVNRTKGYGDWRNWFTEEDVQAFRPILTPWLKKYGYDANDWALNDNPSIEPTHCSEYFMRLVEEQHGRKPAAANKTEGEVKGVSASSIKMQTGRVLRIEPEVVAGWAIGDTPEQPVRVALLVNGVEVAQVVADKPRPGLKERGLHPTGRCGFAFHFGSARCLQIGDQVVVKPVSGDFVLANSPCAVSASGG